MKAVLLRVVLICKVSVNRLQFIPLHAFLSFRISSYSFIFLNLPDFLSLLLILLQVLFSSSFLASSFIILQINPFKFSFILSQPSPSLSFPQLPLVLHLRSSFPFLALYFFVSFFQLKLIIFLIPFFFHFKSSFHLYVNSLFPSFPFTSIATFTLLYSSPYRTSFPPFLAYINYPSNALFTHLSFIRTIFFSAYFFPPFQPSFILVYSFSWLH